jgi:chromosome segregation ATPase
LLASRHLEVRRRAPDQDSTAAAAATPDVPTAQLRLQAQLLVAHEEARELRGDLERAREDLAATRTALESERARHAADAEQFRHDVADVQAAAEEAVAAANGRVAELEAAAGEMDMLRAQAGDHERLRTAVGEARAALAAALDRLPAPGG